MMFQVTRFEAKLLLNASKVLSATVKRLIQRDITVRCFVSAVQPTPML